MIKVFFNNKILLFSENAVRENDFANIQFSTDEIGRELNIFLNDLGSKNVNFYSCSDADAMNFIRLNFTFIYAAGGKIKDSGDNILFIRRLGCWDLPKGKLEEGEEISECAVREVCEECGMEAQDIINDGLCVKTYHIYPYKGHFALKETSWYNMRYVGNGNLKPQTEEDITELKWISSNELLEVLSDTYETIKIVLNN